MASKSPRRGCRGHGARRNRRRDGRCRAERAAQLGTEGERYASPRSDYGNRRGRERDARVRVAAMDALSDLPDDLVRPIREQAPPPEAGGPALDNPVAAREWVDAHGSRATLATLHDAIKSFRDAENRAETSGARSEWLRARGAAHRTLAVRGSRIALTTRARPSARRRLRCRRDLSKRLRILATRVAWSRSRAHGPRRETPDGGLSCRRRRDGL